jgi:hypothetical protein
VNELAEDAQTTRAAAHEAARLRGPRRLLLGGSVVAVGLSALTGLAGLDGRAGFAVFLLLLALVTAVSGVWVAGALLLDEFRGAPTSLRRGLWVAGLFAATLVCMVAIGGVVGTAP